MYSAFGGGLSGPTDRAMKSGGPCLSKIIFIANRLVDSVSEQWPCGCWPRDYWFSDYCLEITGIAITGSEVTGTGSAIVDEAVLE